jgi:hypothetical protein
MPDEWRITGINGAICYQNAIKIDKLVYLHVYIDGLVPWGNQPSLQEVVGEDENEGSRRQQLDGGLLCGCPGVSEKSFPDSEDF